MRANDLARALMSFAELTDFGRSDELYRFARLIEGNTNETIPALFSRMRASTRHPSTLKSSIEAIQKGVLAVGAKKQAAVLSNLLALFAGPSGATVDEFLAEVFPIPGPIALGSMVQDLKNPLLASDVFQRILDQLSSQAAMSRSQLSMIAKSLLGDEYVLRDRRTTIHAIAKHHEATKKRRLAAPSIDTRAQIPRFHSKISQSSGRGRATLLMLAVSIVMAPQVSNGPSFRKALILAPQT